MTDIRTLAEGEKITEAGFYQIPIEQHHNQPCDGVSVTSGVLRKMELETPASVWDHHILNPNRIERPETDALRLGRVMASFIELGPTGVADAVRVLPGTRETRTVAEMIRMVQAGEEPEPSKPNRPTLDQVRKYLDGQATPAAIRAVEYWQEVEADPRIKVSETEWQMICGMGVALAADPSASAVMDGLPEITMAYFDEMTDLWVLSRPDTVSFDGSMSDFKKMSAQGGMFSHRLIDRRIEQHGYHMQMGLAAEAFERLTGNWPTSVGIIAQCDLPPHHVILREISEECLRIGQFQNRRALARFRECLDSGDWPGPGQDVGAFKPSDWWWKRMQDEMQIGEAA